MDWDDNYTAGYYGTIVDPLTWSDTDTFEVNEGSYVNKSNSGVRDSASLALDFKADKEYLIRIYMDTVQGQDIAHDALFTGFITSPRYAYDGELLTQNAQCYGVLKGVGDVKLPLGWYAPKGRRASDIIKELLTNVQYRFDADTPTLGNYIIAENNESNLSMIEKIVTAIDWNMTVDGMGTVIFAPKSKVPKVVFSPDYDLVEEQIDVEHDTFYTPNVLRVVYNDIVEIAKDEDAGSEYSIVNRGREIWEQEELSEFPENTSLKLYAMKKLKELQKTTKEISYSRRFLPNIAVGDVVSFDYDIIKGDYIVTSQKIELSHNGRTEEVAEEYERN